MFLSPNTPVFSDGFVTFYSDTSLPGAPTINGGTIEFLEDLNVPDATFAAGTVKIHGAFNSPVDPEFIGGVVEFYGTYAGPATLLRVTSGAVAFMNPLVDTHAFQNIELRSGGVIRATTARTVLQGPVTLLATSSMDWQTGTIRNVNLRVQPGAPFTASGGTKRFENTYANQFFFSTSLNFDQLDWTDGNIVLLNNVAFGGALASRVDKIGPGNIVTTTNIGSEERFPAITLGLLDHVWSGQTTIEGAYTPRQNVGLTSISAGELRLPDYLNSPFYAANGTLATGQWTVRGTLTLAGATVHTIGSSAAVTMSGAGATFSAISQLSANNGTLTYNDGFIADVTPAEVGFSNSGTMNFRGGVDHHWRKPIVNSGLVSVYEAGTYLGVRKGIGGSGLIDVGEGTEAGSIGEEGPNTTVLEYTNPTPFTGEGRVSFVGDFETVFNADAQILVRELSLDTHRFSGAGAVTIASAVTYASVTVAAGAGEYRIGPFGAWSPGSPAASISLERALVNDGVLEGAVDTTALGLLTNGTTGELVVRGVTGAGGLVNLGTLRAAPGAATRHITTAYTHASTVPLDLAGADLRIAGSITNSGTLSVDGAGLLDLDADVFNESAVAFDGDGAIRFAPGTRLDSSVNTEVRSSTLVFSDANELTGPGTVILAGQIQYGVLVIGPGGTLVIGPSGSLTPSSPSTSSLVLDRAVQVQGLLGGPITTERAGIITIETSGTLDLYSVTGIGEVHNYGLIRNSSGAARTLSVPLLQASSLLFEAPGMSFNTSFILESTVLITGTFGLTIGSGLLQTNGPVVMTAGSVGGFGSIMLAGTFTVSGGSFEVGPLVVVTDTGSLIIDREAPGSMPWGSNVRNFGTVEWRRGSISAFGALENRTNSRFLLTAQEGEHVWSRSGGATHIIENFFSATIERIGAGGSQLFYIPFDNHVGSNVRVLGGDLGALGGGTWESPVEVAAGSTLFLGSTLAGPQMFVMPGSIISGGGNVTIGGLGIGGTSTFHAPLNIGGDLTLLSGTTHFNSFVVAGGDLRVEGGVTNLHSVAFISGFGTFSAGWFTATASPVSILGTVLFSGTTAAFHSSFACQNAEFRSGMVTFLDAFITAAQEPSFTGGNVQFGDEYDAPTAHLLIQAGSVRFDQHIAIGHIELLGGTLMGVPNSLTYSGATQMQATTRFDWGGGFIQDLALSVVPGAVFDAFGGLKTVSFTNTSRAAPLTFGTLNWTLGDINLRDGAALQGGSILKSGPGNLTRTTTIPPPGGGEWQADVFVDLFQNAWNGTTLIEAQWNPGPNRHMHVLQGGVTLTDLSEFFAAGMLTAGTWTVHGTLNLPGASITATAPGATVTLVGSASSFPAINGLVTNGGEITLTGGKTFSFLPTGTTFTNNGLLVLDGAVTHAPQRLLDNSGEIRLLGGTLNMPGGTNSGEIHVASGATLSFSVNHAHSGFATITGAGNVSFLAGTQTITGTLRVIPSLLVTNGGARVTGSGDLRTEGPLTWNGNAQMAGTGRTIFEATSVVTLDGMNGDAFSLRTIENFGIVNHSGGRIFGEGPNWINRPGGTFNLSLTTGHAFAHSNAGATVIFTNEGIFNRTGNTGSSTLAGVRIAFNNTTTGIVNVLQGTLDFNTYVGTNSNDFVVAAGSALRMYSSGDYTHADGATISGAGNVSFVSGTHLFTGTVRIIAPLIITNTSTTIGGAGDLRIEGPLNWNGNARMSGTGRTIFEPTSVVTLDGMNGDAFSLRTIENFGIVNHSGGRIFGEGPNWINRPGGTFNLSAEHAFTHSNAAALVFFTNEGVFNRIGNSGSSILLVGARIVFNNTGEVRVSQGTLDVNAYVFQQRDGNTLTGGRYTVLVNSTLILSGTGLTTIGVGASVTLSGNGSSFPAINTITTVNGTFRLARGRNFTTAGALTNNGTIDLFTSTLNVSGNYTQTSDAELRVSITSSSHGRLNATGTATLAGDLHIAVIGSLPPLGSEFRILSAASRIGSFEAAWLAGRSISYDATGVTLRWRSFIPPAGPFTDPG